MKNSMRSFGALHQPHLMNMCVMLLILLFAAPVIHGSQVLTYRSLNYAGLIVPTPRQAEYREYIEIGDEDARMLTTYIIAEDDPLLSIAAGMLQEHIRELDTAYNVNFQLLTPDDFNTMSEYRSGFFIFLSIGDDSNFVSRFMEEENISLPTQREGYVLETDTQAFPSVFIAGSDARGAFYGVQSLLQMLTMTDNGLITMKEMSVRDWPAYEIRSTGNDEYIPEGDVPVEAVKWLPRFKLNSWAVGQSYHWPEDWRNTPSDRLAALKRAAEASGTGIVDLMFQIHPFGRAEDVDKQYTINISDGSDRRKLVEICLDMLESGAGQILLRADDFHDLTESDSARFGDKAQAHAEIISYLYDNMRSEYPESELIFCPPYYDGRSAFSEDKGRPYFRKLSNNISDDVDIMWTGPDIVSHRLLRSQVARFANLIGRRPFLWDNTVLQEESEFGYRYEYAYYMWHPLNTVYPSNHHQNSRGIRYNYGYDGTRISEITNIVLADYLWNPSAFDFENSLQNAVKLVAGREGAELVLECAADIRELFDLRHSPSRFIKSRSFPAEEGLRTLIDNMNAAAVDPQLVDELEAQWYTHAETSRRLQSIDSKLEELDESVLSKLGLNRRDWSFETEGEWDARADTAVFRFSFPFNTESESGAYGAAKRRINVPNTPTGRYFLVFMADNDYHAEGEPPEAWPGYLYQCVLIDGHVVWERDIVGNPLPELFQIDVSRQLRGRDEVTVELRGCDRRGVTNLGVQISFSPLLLTSRKAKDY